jgi:hypothetical protein
VKVESTIQGTEISATVTRRGIEETSREPSMRIMKKRVLHALFTLSEPPPLPPPFPAPILLEPPPQQTSFFVLFPSTTCFFRIPDAREAVQFRGASRIYSEEKLRRRSAEKSQAKNINPKPQVSAAA